MASRSPATKWIALGLAFTLAWAFFLATSGRVIGIGELKPPTLDPLIVSTSTDFSWTLEDASGQPVKFADFKGRPILLNIWATWCPPCLDEMPSLAKLAENPKVKQMGVAIVCVSANENPAELQAFLNEKTWKMTMLRSLVFPPEFQTEGIPATFLIAPDGRIVASQLGAAQWDDPSVVEFLEKLR